MEKYHPWRYGLGDYSEDEISLLKLTSDEDKVAAQQFEASVHASKNKNRRKIRSSGTRAAKLDWICRARLK